MHCVYIRRRIGRLVRIQAGDSGLARTAETQRASKTPRSGADITNTFKLGSYDVIWNLLSSVHSFAVKRQGYWSTVLLVRPSRNHEIGVSDRWLRKFRAIVANLVELQMEGISNHRFDIYGTNIGREDSRLDERASHFIFHLSVLLLISLHGLFSLLSHT
jgi:hypothetical protein